jgi:hypothetical protein
MMALDLFLPSGGAVSLLALQGIYILIKNYNL